jgi:protein-disulfide isomerase
MNKLVSFFLLLLCAAPIAGAQDTADLPAAAKGAGRAALEDYVRRLNAWPTAVHVAMRFDRSRTLKPLWEVLVRASLGEDSSEEVYYLSSDEKTLLRGQTLNLARHPFDDYVAKLPIDSQPAYGPKNAPVVIVEFSDFQCPFCKPEAEMLRKRIPAEYPNDVRLSFHDFPLSNIHDWAKPAALAGRCIYHQNEALFWRYHDWVYANQPQLSAATFASRASEFAKSAGVDTARYETCLASKETEAEVDKSYREGMAVQLTVTPTLFINGRRIVERRWDLIKQAIDYEIERAKIKADCGCEFKPSLLGGYK